MNDKRKPRKEERVVRRIRNVVVEEYERTSPENEFAIEWGERIATGKMIARGGQSSGIVPGAMPNDQRE